MRLGKYGAAIVIVTTFISIIFMLDMKISDNGEGMTLPVEAGLQRQSDNIDNGIKESTQPLLDNNGGGYENIEDSEETKASLPEKMGKDDRSKYEDTETGFDNLKPSWSEVEKRVEGKNKYGNYSNQMDIDVSDLSMMVKNLSSDERMECINILSKLEPDDIMRIIAIYRDGVTYDDEKDVRDILKKGLDPIDYVRLMNIAEKSYVQGKSKK